MRISFSDAIVISAISASLYVSGFSFETGFAIYFGYPLNLFPVGLSSVVGPWLFYGLVLSGQMLQVNLQTISQGHFGNTMQLLIPFVACSAFFWLLSIVPAFAYVTTLFISTALCLATVYLLHKYPRLRRTGNLGNSANLYDAGGEVPENTLAYTMAKRLGFDLLFVFVVGFVALPLFTFNAGLASAHSNKNPSQIQCSDSDGFEVILRMVGGWIVTTSLGNPTTDKLVRSFRLRRAASISGCRIISNHTPSVL